MSGQQRSGRNVRGRGTAVPSNPSTPQLPRPTSAPTAPRVMAPPAMLQPDRGVVRPQTHIPKPAGAPNPNPSGGNGNGGGGDQGRGGMRNRRALVDVEAPIKTRPASLLSKKGTLGTPIEVIANYFPLITPPGMQVYLYRVDFSEDEDRHRVLRSWLGQHQAIIGEKFVFDNTMIFSPKLLCRAEKPLTLTSLKKDETPVTITIKFVKSIEVGDPTMMQLLNLILRRCMGLLQLQLVGRNLFDSKAATNLTQHRISIWPGYLTSIRQHETQLLLNCEFLNKFLRLDTAYDMMRENPAKFEKNILNTTVMTTYNNKTYRVDDIVRDQTPMSTFEYRGTLISFVDYYKKIYDITIRDRNQPLLLSRPKTRDIRGGRTMDSLLVPELCCMTGLSEEMRANFRLMKEVADVVHISPALRFDRLNKFNQRLLGTPEIKKELESWNLRLDSNLVQFKGRQLPPETILYGGGVGASAGPTADWNRESQDKPMYVNAECRKWFVIVPTRLENDTKNFIRQMIAVAKKMKFVFPEPTFKTIRNDTGSDIVRAVEEIISYENVSLIFFAVENVNADRYSAIKKKCYLDRGITSQVVTRRVLTNKNLMTVASKVAIQINAKLGGSPWSIKMPSMGAMIVGFDVCHDPLSKAKSYGALVATSNEGMTSYFSTTTNHSEGEELSDTIAADILKATQHWISKNNSRPNRIIVYRDGVGEGQTNHVVKHEVGAIKKALQTVFKDSAPALTFIIVTKRLNTRFFTKNKTNPGPGVVIDDVITLPEKQDFFLVSQHTKQGTAMPTAYNVIEDGSGWNPDKLQRLTFMMTHLYYNLSGTVRVPAVVQYAHRLAFLTSEFLHGKPHDGLSDRLFFI